MLIIDELMQPTKIVIIGGSDGDIVDKANFHVYDNSAASASVP